MWKPSAAIINLQKKARYIQAIRQYFHNKKVMEVQVPTLGSTTVSDPYIQSFSTQWNQFNNSESQKKLYLQTSPEYFMKRLLAAGSGDIYSLAPAYRNEPTGRYHNPEFLMLEWYRLNYSLQDIMDEVSHLLNQCFNFYEIARYSYLESFEMVLNINPHTIPLNLLHAVTVKHLGSVPDHITREDHLDLLLDQVVIKKLDHQYQLKNNNHDTLRGIFIYHYPKTMASLAKIKNDEQNNSVGERFELYINAIEIANGYHELTNYQEQIKRFEQDNINRTALHYNTVPIDYHLLHALQAGLPHCSGVALGIDRLIMLVLQLTHIKESLSFDIHSC